MISSSESLKKTFPEFLSILSTQKPTIVDIKDTPNKGFIKGSTFIIFNDKFKVLLPGVLKLDAPLLFVCDPAKTEEVFQALKEAGYSNILGYLEGGFDNWVGNKGEAFVLPVIESEKFKTLYETNPKELSILDVRNKNEWETGVLQYAQLISLKELEKEVLAGKLEDLKKNKIYLFCGLGGRSMIALSILKRNGFEDLIYIAGGSKKMGEIGIEFKKVEL